MKYTVIYRDKDLPHAGSKAPKDVSQILRESGYRHLYVGKNSRIYLIKSILLRLSIISLIWRVKKGSTLLLQYPTGYSKSFSLLYRIITSKNLHLEVLIHDLRCVRDGSRYLAIEKRLLSHADRIIAHTPDMKRIIVERLGINPEKITILYLFDYLADSSNQNKSQYGNSILFAGNINKSLFIRHLKEECYELEWHLYGIADPKNIPSSNNVYYEGIFSPDDISGLKGDWGLVWDGDSLETCSGRTGEYLRINSSHKLSLYIAAEKPVIIWSESSLCKYITENHLGISVNNLHEIHPKISMLTEEQKATMRENLHHFSQKLRKGEMLKDILKSKS